MEIYDIGKHCTYSGCNQLDFLPYKCNRCGNIYCQEHCKVNDHTCPLKDDPKYDKQVLICPICSQPIPVPHNQDPNIAMDQHIAQNCPRAPTSAVSQPVYLFSCNVTKCSIRSMVPIRCNSCGLSYCLRHRHDRDHHCEVVRRGQMSKRLEKLGGKGDREPGVGTAKNLTEDEQVAIAMSLSLQDQSKRNESNSSPSSSLPERKTVKGIVLTISENIE